MLSTMFILCVKSFLLCIVGKLAGWCECVVVSFPSCLAGF